MHSHYWTDEDRRDLKVAQTYRDLSKIALQVLARMPEPRGELCGPITSGGAGSVEANLRRFDRAIQKLTEEGTEIFSQMPFEMIIQEMRQKMNLKEYDTYILNDFYLPIFESGFIHTLYFLPDWETSVGARWEHEQAERLGIAIIYLDVTHFGEYE
ncbi:MAG TPA: DUF4406 domain-containing protein [Candidatus Paceibacterota bacterium]